MRARSVFSLLMAVALTVAVPTAAHADEGDMTLHGQLLVGGTPAAGALVGIISTSAESWCAQDGDPLTAVTDENGNFSITASPSFLPASSRIASCGGALGDLGAWTGAAADGTETLQSPYSTRPFTRTQLEALTAPITIAADAPGRIRLTGLSGNRYAQVGLLTVGDVHPRISISCARKTSCTSNALPTGRYRVQVEDSGSSGTWTSGWVHVDPGATQDVPVPALAIVTGRVRVAGGATGQRYGVNVNPNDDSSLQFGVEAAKNGTYRLPGLFAGRYALQVVAYDGGAPRGVEANTTELTVTAGQRRSVDLHERSGTTVTGTMSGLAPEGRQYAGTVLVMRGLRVVQFGGAASATSTAAPLQLHGVPKGQYTLVALAGDRMSTSRLVVSGSGTHRLAATVSAQGQALHLSGRVVGATSASVTVERLDGFASGGAVTTHGRYTITGLAPGQYRVRITAFRHVIATSMITLRQSTKRTLHAGAAYAAVTARLVDELGPITNAWVVPADADRVSKDDHAPFHWPLTGSTGRFTLYLAPGRYSSDFFLGVRDNPDGPAGRASPYALNAVAPTPFLVEPGKKLDLGTITVETIG